MPGGFTISLSAADLATPRVQRISAEIQRPDVRKVMGRAMATDVRKHFTKLDGERANQLGGQRTHFYGQARRGVQQPELVGGDGVKVTINNVGIAQRFFGGDIYPVHAGALTIPSNPAAYGHRAGEFNLHAIYFRDGSGVLVKDGTESKFNIGEIYFRLLKHVYQKPDPSVLPSSDELQEVAMAAGDAHLKTLIERGTN